VRIFEGSVDHADVVGPVTQGLRVGAFHVEREIPLTALFGARAGEVVGVVDAVSRLPWLRSSAASEAGLETRVQALVAEHYAALSDYAAVSARPLRLVRTWHEARDWNEELEPKHDAELMAVQAACHGGDVDINIALQLAQHRIVRSAFFAVWDAAWSEAGRSAATGARAASLLGPLPEMGEHDRADIVTRAVSALANAHGAAREPARRAGWNAAYELFAGDGNLAELYGRPDVLFAEAVVAAQKAVARDLPHQPRHVNCAACASAPAVRATLAADFTMHTGRAAWAAAVGAAQTFTCRAAYLIQAVPHADPWRPLIDIWRLGGWPVGASGGAFTVFVPAAMS
jgi:hypothetical protein